MVQVIAECRGLRARCDRLEEIDLQREQSEQGTNKKCLERIKGYHCFVNGADLRQQISRMAEDLREKQHLVEKHARKEQQIEVSAAPNGRVIDLCLIMITYIASFISGIKLGVGLRMSVVLTLKP